MNENAEKEIRKNLSDLSGIEVENCVIDGIRENEKLSDTIKHLINLPFSDKKELKQNMKEVIMESLGKITKVVSENYEKYLKEYIENTLTKVNGLLIEQTKVIQDRNNELNDELTKKSISYNELVHTKNLLVDGKDTLITQLQSKVMKLEERNIEIDEIKRDIAEKTEQNDYFKKQINEACGKCKTKNKNLMQRLYELDGLTEDELMNKIYNKCLTCGKDLLKSYDAEHKQYAFCNDECKIIYANKPILKTKKTGTLTTSKNSLVIDKDEYLILKLDNIVDLEKIYHGIKITNNDIAVKWRAIAQILKDAEVKEE